MRRSDGDGAGDGPGAEDRSVDPHSPGAVRDLACARRRPAGRVPRRILPAALFCAVAGALLWSAPALALSQRGHAFSFTFTGAETEKLLKPSGVAVNESTGDVYVVDAGKNRVERFHPEPESKSAKFIEAWGWGVKDGEEKYEQCTSGCKPGIAGTGEGQFSEPEAIAVDNSTSESDPSRGDVYVVSETAAANNAIEKFSSEGTVLGRLTTENPAAIGGVAVDSTGVVWAYEYEAEKIDSFNDAFPVNGLSSTITAEVGACGRPGFAVDAKGEAFYANRQLEDFEEACPEHEPSPKFPALIAKLRSSGEPPSAKVVTVALDSENTTAAAVDLSSGQQESGDVYIINERIDHETKEIVTSIAAFDSSGALVQRFGAEAGLTKGAGVAVDAAPCSETKQPPGCGEIFVANAAKNRIEVFEQRGNGAPEVDGVSAQNETPTSTQLEARIDPRGLETKYEFQYGTVDCKENESSCTVVPGTIPAGLYGDQLVTAPLENLQPGTTYFYRVLAENADGKAPEASETFHTFTTLPNPAGLLADGRAWELVSPPEKAGATIEPLGAGFEGPRGGLIQASEDGQKITYAANAPVETEPPGNRSTEGTQIVSTRGAQAWSSKEIITPHNNGEGLASGVAQEYRFFTPDLSLGLAQPFGKPFNRLMEPPLAPLEEGATTEERGIYRRHNTTCEVTPATCYEPLVTAKNDTGEEEGKKTEFGGALEFLSATSDLSHVVFRSDVALTADPSAEQPLYEWTAGKPPSEQLQLISWLPGNKKPVERAELGHELTSVSRSARNAISNDGSRVFLENQEKDRLYMRDTARGITIQVNAAEEGIHERTTKQEEEGTQINEVAFRTASSDGSRVFFTDTTRLTEKSELEEVQTGPSDLYVCEVIEGPETPECKLKDLTVDPQPNIVESADVVGTVVGISEEGCDVGSSQGCSVYFVANGVLAPGAAPGHCPRPEGGKVAPPGATCNLYQEQYDGKWEKPKLIAILSADDAPDWAVAGERLSNLTARVSPNGRYLAFMSKMPLTEYDNEDVTSEHPGERLDEEVFLYDASTERLICASCNPQREKRPRGVFDSSESTGEGRGLRVDPEGVIWGENEQEILEGLHFKDHWLAGSIPGFTPVDPKAAPYQSRYLLDDGRLFFNSADALVEQDVNRRQEPVNGKQVEVGVEDVYQYEPQGIGSCAQAGGCVSLLSPGSSPHESAFLDASASGEDAYFLTDAPLVAGDIDTAFDVYDARVCTGSSPCFKSNKVNPSPCEANPSEASCRTPAPPPPGFGAPLSATFSGPGNTAKQETPPPVKPKPKPLSRAQKLKKALASCRKKFKHAKKKRAACERQAKKRYGAKKAAKHKKGKK